MYKNLTTIFVTFLLGIYSYSQVATTDTTLKPPREASIIDTTLDYAYLMDDLESFLDSLLSPHSYFMGTLTIGKGYYNYETKSNVFLEAAKKFTYTPALGYFDKSGLSLLATGSIINLDNKLNLYQVAVSPGYDYLENRRFAMGVTYTRYFTKDSLNFYTTPLQNEIYTYFTYRKWWVRPTIALSYGWGSRTDYMARETLLQDLRLRRSGFTTINSKESISDFSVITSLRHDFYWLNIFGHKDHIRFTPQLSFISGTQKFGFNQSANTYATLIRTGANVLYNSENVYLDDQLEFQPLSMTMFLRTEYSIGKFFLQPQLIFDYYFPASDKNFSTLFSFNLGFIL